jgi:integrase
VHVMVNRELACLRALYNRCRDWGKYGGDNPVVKVRPVQELTGRLRYLETDEIDALLVTAREPTRTLILVGLYTGVRIQSEALTLRWANLELRRGLLTVQSVYAKSGKTRTVPLNRPAVAP